MSGVAREVSSDEELRAAFAVRHEVFVVEQQVPVEEELDDRDATAVQIVVLDDADEIVGTCRVLDDADGVARVGRMAVLARARGHGYARQLIEEAEQIARARGDRSVVLDAQLTARGFYERAGYLAHGGTFMDAGIEHVAMSKPLRS